MRQLAAPTSHVRKRTSHPAIRGLPSPPSASTAGPRMPIETVQPPATTVNAIVTVFSNCRYQPTPTNTDLNATINSMHMLDESNCPINARQGYKTDKGLMLRSTIEEALKGSQLSDLRGQVALLLTSPPFPLNRKKAYGNLNGDRYLNWLSSLAPSLSELLTPDGSIILEIGNSWEQGLPVMSTLPLEALLEFKRAGDLYLCQQFIGHNPARLPGPAQWVTIKRIRLKDTYTHIWWLSKTPTPKANNRHVLQPYSSSMLRLLARQDYNRSKRPSGHDITGDTFLTDNGGAIPSNVLVYANTRSNDRYRAYCRKRSLRIHPARMQPEIASFFVRLLTDKNDLVFDPFAGSNTTGQVAEDLGRRWLSIEPNPDYVEGSAGRFDATQTLTNHHLPTTQAPDKDCDPLRPILDTNS